MTRLRTKAIKAGLETLYFSGAHLIARPFLRGRGVILTMHRVCPRSAAKFHPNDLLEIMPEFLEETISAFKRADIDIIDLDEAVVRLNDERSQRRFAVLTFDDGYRDNFTAGWQVLRRMKVPFTIYIPTAFPQGQGNLWWIALENIIAGSTSLTVEIEGRPCLIKTGSLADKNKAYAHLHGWLRGLANNEREHEIEALCRRYGVNLAGICQELMMSWRQIAEMAGDPRVTIGAHTVHHYQLSKLDENQARFEMRESANVIETMIGKRPRHFSFPYGWADAAGPREFALAREEGFVTAVTTRPGLLYGQHAQHLTALPRLSLNGRFQTRRYLDVLLSGLPTYVSNGFERCNVA